MAPLILVETILALMAASARGDRHRRAELESSFLPYYRLSFLLTNLRRGLYKVLSRLRRELDFEKPSKRFLARLKSPHERGPVRGDPEKPCPRYKTLDCWRMTGNLETTFFRRRAS